MSFKNFPMVSKVIYGRGAFDQLTKILEPKRKNSKAPFIFLIDEIFEKNYYLTSRITRSYQDQLIFISADEEPKTSQVDALVEELVLRFSEQPSGIIGIGGGTILDIAKAVSIMLTNIGKSEDYQGWDLVKNPAIYHVGIPTISGTGAEVSRTAVLNGPTKKLGINSDYTPFDQVILDPDLIKDVPKDQRFYTGMDCFIHCVESLNGTYLNAFSQSYGEKAYEMCKQIFLQNNLSKDESDEQLMMASWHGGMSIAYSQVGVAHALSYGLSFVLGIKHGIGNCIVFNQLEEYYPEDVKLFKQMMVKNQITLPSNVCKDISQQQLDRMVEIALCLEPLWENALGENWQSKIDETKIESLYKLM